MKNLSIISICIILFFSSQLALAQPSWNYSETSTSHTLVVQSASLNGSPLTAGDYIGVFFSDAGNLYCGGYMLWTGSSGAFTAYGDDTSTGNKEGFNENETLLWQVWQQVNNQIVSMTPILSIGTNSFGNNGMSVISSLNGETVSSPIQFSAITTDLTCASNCNGSINLNVTGGTPPFSFEWSNGTNTQNIDSLCSGIYTVTVSGSTGESYTYAVQINSPTYITINATLSDYNGFEVSQNNSADGFIQLSLSGGIPPYTYLWSNGATMANLDGLSANKYIVTITDSVECNVIEQFEFREPLVQTIPLKSGWGIFSTNLIPLNSNISNVLSPLGSNLKIVKNGNGQIYWPQYGVNLIGNLSPGYGYQSQLTIADTIEVSGAGINPVETPIVLQANWNLLGYLHQYPLDIPFLLSDIASNLVIMKNELGQAYWPQYNVNLIGNLQPGKGYQIKMSQTDTLNFSEETLYCFIDERDNVKYKTVKIGNQIWMAENLKYLPSVISPGIGSETIPYYYVYDYNGTNVSEAKATANYSTYGVLYNWAAATDDSCSSESNPSGVQGACPSGWHLPCDAEWNELEGFLGGASLAGGKMKEIGLSHWISPNSGATNESGFLGLPGGLRTSAPNCVYQGSSGYWWTSTCNNIYAKTRDLWYYDSHISWSDYQKYYGFSVRCIKNESSEKYNLWLNTQPATGGIAIGKGKYSEGQTINITAISDSGYIFVHWTGDTAYIFHPDSASSTLVMPAQNVTLNAVFQISGTVTDPRDGNQYNYISIGNQVWMTENLKYLPSVVDPGTGSETIPYYYVYDYNGTNVNEAKATAKYSTYGVLYNWPAAMAGSMSSNSNPSGVQGVCPSGWHLPSDAEWAELEGYLGGESVAGGKMKEVGLAHWNSPNTGATNESGFTGLPGGDRLTSGTLFFYIGHVSDWWSSTEYNTNYTWVRQLVYSYSSVFRNDSNKSNGFSVRCVRD